MAFSLGELVLAFTAGTDSFTRGISIVTGALKKLGDDAEKNTSRVGETFKNAAIGIGVIVGSTAALFAAVNSATQSVGALNDEVRPLGLNAEQFQKLTFAAKDFDISAGSVSAALRIFNRNLGQTVNAGANAQSVFKTLGISLTDGLGNLRPTQALIEDFADALATKVPNAQQRAAFAVEAFGRAGAGLVPLFEGGSAALREFGQEAEDLGLIFSNELVRKADIAAEAFDRLTAVFGVQTKAALVEIAPLFLDLASFTLPLLGDAVRFAVRFFLGLQVSLAGLQVVVVGLVGGLGVLLKALLALARFSGQGLESIALVLKGDVVGAVKLAEKAQGEFLEGFKKDVEGVQAAVGAATGALGDSVDRFAKVDAQLGVVEKRFDTMAKVAEKAGEAIRKAVDEPSKAASKPLEVTSTEGAGLLKQLDEERAAAAAKLLGPLREQALAIDRQIKSLQEAKLSDADRIIANAHILRLTQERARLLAQERQDEEAAGNPLAQQALEIERQITGLRNAKLTTEERARADALILRLQKQQAELLDRSVRAQSQLPDLFDAVNTQLARLSAIDPQRAAEFANELGVALSQALGPEEQAQTLARLAQSIGTAVEQQTPRIAAEVGGGVADGLQAAFSGDNGLQAFGRTLQQIGQSSLNKAFTEAGNDLGKILQDVFPKALSGLGSLLTGIFGAVLGAVFNRTQVESSAANVQSAITNAQQVRGVVAGPTSLGIAQVGLSIREAFRESERLLAIIARNTAPAGRAGSPLAAGLEGPAFALANESASLT